MEKRAMSVASSRSGGMLQGLPRVCLAAAVFASCITGASAFTQPPGMISLSSDTRPAVSVSFGRTVPRVAFPLRGARMQAGGPGGPGDEKGQGQVPVGTNLPVGWRGPAYGEPVMPEPPKLNKAQEMMIRGIMEKSKNSKKTKRVKFGGKTSATVKADDRGVGSNVTLGTYMTLPAEQWITLDDRFISRLDSGGSDAQAEYRFTLPLKQIANLPLTLTCDVKVDINKPKSELIISATGARIRGSTKEDDEMKIPDINQTMSAAQTAMMSANVTESVQLADMTVGFSTKISWTEGQDEKQGGLALSSDVEVEITLPPPPLVLPGVSAEASGWSRAQGRCVADPPEIRGACRGGLSPLVKQPAQGGGVSDWATVTAADMESPPFYYPPPSALGGADGRIIPASPQAEFDPLGINVDQATIGK
eukprot:CAMPEP_0180280966 /NCGR_PEP_ID=MMETSP0988-20121125/8940_1 /TAXON_ID=697907 /ORGANISM="non described non described, Strain CCMP2293" /LENGTH=419 /DNA_ID=CAMNT_0022252899 /DNA_START=10 /DNA_END=1270 /DNA_ORIENTATION=-